MDYGQIYEEGEQDPERTHKKVLLVRHERGCADSQELLDGARTDLSHEEAKQKAYR